jgi:hypothetical protein
MSTHVVYLHHAVLHLANGLLGEIGNLRLQVLDHHLQVPLLHLLLLDGHLHPLLVIWGLQLFHIRGELSLETPCKYECKNRDHWKWKGTLIVWIEAKARNNMQGREEE